MTSRKRTEASSSRIWTSPPSLPRRLTTSGEGKSGGSYTFQSFAQRRACQERESGLVCQRQGSDWAAGMTTRYAVYFRDRQGQLQDLCCGWGHNDCSVTSNTLSITVEGASESASSSSSSSHSTSVPRRVHQVPRASRPLPRQSLPLRLTVLPALPESKSDSKSDSKTESKAESKSEASSVSTAALLPSRRARRSQEETNAGSEAGAAPRDERPADKPFFCPVCIVYAERRCADVL